MQLNKWSNYKQSNKQNDIDFANVCWFKNFEFARIEFFVIYTIWLIANILIFWWFNWFVSHFSTFMKYVCTKCFSHLFYVLIDDIYNNFRYYRNVSFFWKWIRFRVIWYWWANLIQCLISWIHCFHLLYKRVIIFDKCEKNDNIFS